MMRSLLLAVVAVTLGAPAVAEPLRKKVDGQRALETVKLLASDEFQGRKSGLDSGRKAEMWMARRIAEIGLMPPNRFSYFHDFKANVTTEGSKAEFGLAGGGKDARKGVYLDDFVTLIYSGQGEVTAPVVFVGYGIHAPDKDWDDYAGLDVKGKIVLAVRGKPSGSAFQEERYIGYKSSTAADRGAAGFLLVEGDSAVPGTIQETYYRGKLPAVWLSRKAADDLLGRAGAGTLEEAKKRARAGKASKLLEGVTATLSIAGQLLRDRPMRNVVGLYRGSGAYDQYVVIGAHLDHVGVDAAGNVYNGADDNASGSAMLLEVARAITASKERFARHILFVWFAGEEQGLLGSWAFVKRPPVPLDKIAVMINVDMVGQGKPVLAIGGAEVYPRDAAWFPRLPEFKTKPFRSQANSDHYPFQTRGVPAFFVHTQGPHPNYHKPGDDWQNIKPELLEVSGRYVRRLAERSAQTDEPLCRPRRLAEYLWHDAKVVSLWGGRGAVPHAGIDLAVEWFQDDFGNLGRAMQRAGAKDGDAVAVQGHRLSAALNNLKPGVFFGVKGAAAVRHRRIARAAGVTFYGPWLGPDPLDRPAAWPRLKGSVLCLHGAPEDLDLAKIEGPILLGPIEAERWREHLKSRRDPWLVTPRFNALKENKQHVWENVAQNLLHTRKLYGANRVALTPVNAADEFFTAQAPTLLPGLVDELTKAGLKRADLYPFLGGNLVRFLEKALKE